MVFLVGKIDLIFLCLSCVEFLSLRSFRPLRPWERPHVRARRSSFNPRRVRKAEGAFRVRIGRNVWLWLKVEENSLCIHAHNAKRILNQNKQSTFHRFRWYVLVVTCLFSLNNYGCAALYQKKSTRVWKIFEVRFYPALVHRFVFGCH